MTSFGIYGLSLTRLQLNFKVFIGYSSNMKVGFLLIFLLSFCQCPEATQQSYNQIQTVRIINMTL